MLVYQPMPISHKSIEFLPYSSLRESFLHNQRLMFVTQFTSLIKYKHSFNAPSMTHIHTL